MPCPRRGTHLKHNIVQTGPLRRRPMNARRLRPTRDSPQIEDEIPNLPQEYIGALPIQILSEIWVSINKAEASEIRRRFKDRWAVGVAN
jgi:hypothetical protein